MKTTGDAYKMAQHFLTELGREGAAVVNDLAENCKLAGDLGGYQFWHKVYEFMQFLDALQ